MIFLTMLLLSAHASERGTQPVVLVGDSVLDTPHKDEFVEQEEPLFQAFDIANYYLKTKGFNVKLPVPKAYTVLEELQKTLGQNYEVINNARAGWTSENVLNGRDGFEPLEKPMEGAVVILSIGGNDFYQPLKKAVLTLNKEAVAGILESNKNRKRTTDNQKQIVEAIKKQNPKQIIASLQYDPDFQKLCSAFKKENLGPLAEYFDSTNIYEGCKDIMDDMRPEIKEAIDANRDEMIKWYKENGVTVADLRQPFFTENIKFDGLHLNNKGITSQVEKYKELILAQENKIQDQA